ncbi:NAD(P)/FAD-dependent oxidoreductase [Lentibacillus salinarum]|uniref:NAD(P)/FAD-dependent oxidoreductase n=1 Tax=Lentibacillus salinarum TaxID=446820 RepID=A0ABW3ZT56_9BACI
MGKPNIVILGAGYGGLMTAVKLEKMLPAHKATVTLVNKYDYHYQTTWLHEIAAGTLHHDRARIPVKDVINMEKTRFIVDNVIAIKPDEKTIKLESGELSYDILVIALGVEPATYGIPGLDDYAFTIETVNNARLLKEHLEYNFAKYHHEDEKNKGRLNIVVGGGVSGVEYLGELTNRIPDLCDEYDIHKTMIRVINIEQSSTVLPDFDPQLAKYAMSSLESRGVEFITGARLKECKPDHVIYEKAGKHETIPTYTTVWTGGVRTNSIAVNSGFTHNQGEIDICDDMRVSGFEDVFAIDECTGVTEKESDKLYPLTANMAIQQSDIVVHNVKALIQGEEEFTAYKPKRSGTVVSLGHTDATGTILNNRKLFGWKAVMLKKLIDNYYLLRLGGFNQLMRKGKFNIFY